MSEPVSILDVIKRGGYEASLITTFNATLPFYEEVLLRKLVGAGCRHNVVLMDRAQCAISWSTEASRPRLAGHAYTLLPVGAPGAFHPKICILVGPKKAALLIGSHNLTLSGFGYNNEVTNWIEVAGVKDTEGAALLSEAWKFARNWIEMERGKAPDSVLNAALALVSFIGPLTSGSRPSGSTFLLAHGPSGPPLIDQVAERVPFDVARIAVVGPFLDRESAFICELAKRWPKAHIVVGVDPESVQMPAPPPGCPARFVDVRPLWPDRNGYLHAKMIWFDGGDRHCALVSGSANPSGPAWMGPSAACNVEAVLLRVDSEARGAVEAIGLPEIFGLSKLDADVLDDIVTRTAVESESPESAAPPVWFGVSDLESGEIRINRRTGGERINRVVLLDADAQPLGAEVAPPEFRAELTIRAPQSAAHVRSCLLYSDGGLVARAMIHHPAVIAASSQSSRQNQIRNALAGLGAAEGDISKVIASVERVIFSDDSHRETETALRERREVTPNKTTAVGPHSLAVSVADLRVEKKKLRLLKSGDLAYLIEVLFRSLGEGLERAPSGTDITGLTEEERVGSEDGDESQPPELTLPPTALTDAEIAKAVSARARALIRRMGEQLRLAAAEPTRRASAAIQLIAVIALVRELRHLDKTARWKATGQLLVEEKDRRHLLDDALKHLLGSASRMLEEIDKLGDSDTEEGTQLRVLLVWLAWDLGEELTDQIGRIWDANELRAKLCANAMFLKLIPPIAQDAKARSELEKSIFRTLRPTPEAALRANKWLEEHLRYGTAWARGANEGGALRVGGYCHVPGKVPDPRVVLEVSQAVIGFWDYDRVWRFSRERVVGVAPAESLT